MTKKTYSPNDLLAYAQALPGKKVLVFGDIMLDRYLHGDASRISPEAPVPVVHVESYRQLMGGAGNVAHNIRSLGGQVSLFSVCGDDSSADILSEMCASAQINTRLFRAPERKTTTKNRIIARHQQVLRFDEENLEPLPPSVHEEMLQALFAELPEFDVLIVSDYGKGLVNDYFMSALRKRISAAGLDIKLVVDPKTPNYHLYSGAFLLTPNAKETSEATGLPARTVEEVKLAGCVLKKNLKLDNLLTTLGAQGMALFDSNGNIRHIPTVAKDVFDVTGAGDTVIAVTSLCLAAGVPLLPACIIANYAAGIVVGEVGAAAVSLEELSRAVREHSETLISSWQDSA